MAETERSLPTTTTTPMQYFLPGQHLPNNNKLSPPSSTDEIKEPLSKRIKIDDQSISSNQNNTSLLSSSSTAAAAAVSTWSDLNEEIKLDFELENFLNVNINGAAHCESSNCENPVPLQNTVKNENESVEQGKGEEEEGLIDSNQVIRTSTDPIFIDDRELCKDETFEPKVNNDGIQGDPTDSSTTTNSKVKKKKLTKQTVKGKVKVKSKGGGEDVDSNNEESKKKKKVRKKKTKETSSKEPKVPGEDDGEESETGSTDNPSTKSNKSSKSKKKNKAAHLRKNIRDIMSANQLEKETLAAQREEAERRQRMNLKLQQQQLSQVLTRPNPIIIKEEIDPILTPENCMTGDFIAGITEIPSSSQPTQQQQQQHPVVASSCRIPSIIDEVTLSSDDDEQPKPEMHTELSKLKTSLTDFRPLQETNISGGGPFRSSGGIMTKHDVDENVISLTSPDEQQNARDSDSSDDCVVISPPSFHDEVEKEGREDENNVPDEFGRVLVNVAHPPEDEDIFLAPQIARAVKPHQIGGIRFLYDNVVESLDRFDTSNGFGCILAHSMGLGKTIQAVSFCDIFLRYTRATKVLIIVPINTIQNWQNEFNCWIPPEDHLRDTTVQNSTKLPPSSSSTGIEKKFTKRKSKLEQDSVKQSNNNNEESPTEQTTTSSPCGSRSPISPLSSSYLQPTELSQLSSSPQQQLQEEDKTEQSVNTLITTDSTTTTPSDSYVQPDIFTENSTMETNSNSNNTEDKCGGGEVRPRSFQLFILNETVKTLSAREKIITEWNTKGGVLLLGYEMYRMLALKRLKRSSKKKSAALDDATVKNRMIEQMSLDNIYSCIVNPGPDLVLCDEGHRIKNSGASISQALKAVRTKRRVVLTGYPLQNNLMEYWCMVDFVRPNYLGSKVEFANMFERPITNGQCADSSSSDKKLMRYRSHVLHTLLEGFVQRRSHLVLQSALPFKEEWVFFLKMTSVQYTLYKEFIRYLKEERQEKEREKNGSSESPPSTNPIKAFAICCKIWNHPDALYNVVKKNNDILDDLDLDDIATEEQSKKVRTGRKSQAKDNHNTILKGATQPITSSSTVPSPTNSDFNFNTDLLGLSVASMANIPATVVQSQQRSQNNQSHNQSSFSSYNMSSNGSSIYNSSQTASTPDGRSISLDWSIPVFKNYTSEVLENGVKFQLLFIILEEVVVVGDKLLVFSQSLLTLDLIELFLGKKFNWKKNKEYFRLDGSTSGLEREKLIDEFNEKEGIHLFIISSRAGSLGINLIGANRVIVFDASWNPSIDAQAVCRVYRYGQKKECQIYRFVTDCSLEKRIYDRQINKRGMADRVVDEMNPETLLTSEKNSFLVLDHEQMDALQSVNHNFNMDKFGDPVLRKVLNRCADRFTREPFEHESLLIDRKETKLSANEKRIAHRNYQMEKSQTGSSSGSSYNRPSYAAFYQQQQESQSLGVPIHPSFSSSNLGYSGYNSSVDNRNLSSSYIDHHHSKSGNRPFQEQMMELRKIQQQRLQMQQYQTQRQKNLNFPFQALKDRGIDVQSMLVKKDAYMKDPGTEGGGGPEIYLRAGEKIHIFRSKQGIYFRVPNGRIIRLRDFSGNLLPKGLSVSDNLSEEQIQSIVFSLLRPAGKLPPPYFNSCLNGPKPDIPQFFGTSSSAPSSSSLSHSNLFKTNRPPPSLQKLPPTVGILPSYQNHQITNFRNNTGGDVTIWRKNSDPAKNRVKSGLNVSPPSTPPTPNYHHQIMPKQVGASNNSANTSSGRKDGEVEVIEFDTHFGDTRFGELLNPRIDDLKISSSSSSSSLNALLNQNPSSSTGGGSRRRKDQLSKHSRSTYSPLTNILQDNSNSSAEVQFNSQSQGQSRSSDPPDISITTIASAPGGQQNNFPSLNLGNLLSGNVVDNNIVRNSSSNNNKRISGGRSSSFSSPFKSLGGVSENSRNTNNLLWDQNLSGCSSTTSNSGSDQNSNNSNNCPDDDNLESLFWSNILDYSSSTGESPSKSKLPGMFSGSNNNIVTPNVIPNNLITTSSDLDGMMNDEDMVSSSWNQHSQHNYRHINVTGEGAVSQQPGMGSSRFDFDSDAMVQNMLRGAGTQQGRGGIIGGYNGPTMMNNQSVNSSGIHKSTRDGNNFSFPLPSASSNIDVFGNVFENPATCSPPVTSSGNILGNPYDDFLGAAATRMGVFGGGVGPVSHHQHLQNMLKTGQYYSSSLNQSGESIGHGTNSTNSHNFPTNLPNICNFNLNNN